MKRRVCPRPQGYTITATNYGSSLGEAEIMVQPFDGFVFVEGKLCRAVAYNGAEGLVPATESQRIIANAQYDSKGTIESRLHDGQM